MFGSPSVRCTHVPGNEAKDAGNEEQAAKSAENPFEDFTQHVTLWRRDDILSGCLLAPLHL